MYLMALITFFVALKHVTLGHRWAGYTVFFSGVQKSGIYLSQTPDGTVDTFFNFNFLWLLV